MIGILFHGPEVFDSGWARRIVDAFSPIVPLRLVLAGAMGRTAAIDSGIPGIESPGAQPSQILRQLEGEVDQALFANFGKSPNSGLLHGAMIAEKAGVGMPLIQIECSGSWFVELNPAASPETLRILEGELGLTRHDRVASAASVWECNGRTCRRLTTAVPGDFVLVDGIVIGRALGGDVVIECDGRRIARTGGIEIKTHGLEKLDRRGGVDLATVKLATTRTLRRMDHAPRITKRAGAGMAFVDHAAMNVYDRIGAAAGAVTVGDDTTAIVGDILYRFGMPVIGIVDGDRDVILESARMTPGSVVFTVRQDDVFGLTVFSEVFKDQPHIHAPFEKVRAQIAELVRGQFVAEQEF